MADRMVDVVFRQAFSLERCAFQPGDKCQMPLSRARGLVDAGIANLPGLQLPEPGEARIGGMLRVRNEERWIAEVLRSMLPVCDAGIALLDDSSDDRTFTIVQQVAAEALDKAGCERIVPIHSPYGRVAGIDEGRDKDLLVGHAMTLFDPDWIVSIDGDEVLAPGAKEAIRGCVTHGNMWAYSFKVVYLWDRVDQIREDGIYGNFWRPSLFFTRASDLKFRRTAHGGNFHCSNVPGDLLGSVGQARCRLKHYGYLDREQRIAKWQWYNAVDPGNQLEDCYRHVVQGDIPEVPASAELVHAGPLRLGAWT